ncbi:rhodanese-like domain-containing protein [Geotalea toluenoxydans]|uniref:rhodanese-like domain-containing protein n=1 Tax=Geotalea toluenoxydans TaxID=421624 RepID=UPI0006D24972|nr:rhodanese-like domain-containing protein [Geotalea toluenoxydans]
MAKLLTEQFEITADDLKSRMKSGKPVFLVNLRHHGDWDVGLIKARGALRVADDELEQHLGEIPHDQEIVICYLGPGDRPSVEVAQMLQRKGWRDVHPLKGGFSAYLDAGLPVEDLKGRSVAKKRMLLSGA